MKLLIGTANKGKAIEVQEALKSFGVECVLPTDLGIEEKPEETGTTYEENARLKANFYYERTGLAVLSDDSGIVVEALKDELGVYTRRWGAGDKVTDQEWVEYFLKRLENAPTRRAQFVCCLCFKDAEGNEHIFEGTADGVITEALETDYKPGLPVSACFRPDGYDKVYNALTVDEKNAISHRGRALRKLKEYFASL